MQLNIFFLFLIAAAETAVTLEQDQLTVTKSKSKTARIRCKVFGTDATSATIHWYQQKDGEALKRILYIAGAASKLDTGFSESIFSANKNSKESNLIIQNVQEESHSATYYCAYWDSHSGTQTIGRLYINHLTLN
ncbi:TRGV3 protein, partial [Amia calva]|nr:TRGV3 protein [Amia calva]